MQNYFEVIILGAVQGLTEFLPISSSGHLVIVREIFGFQDQGVAFDAVLHLATALAILVYFWLDWKNIFQSVISKKNNRAMNQSRRLLFLIFMTTLPAIAVALLFGDTIEAQVRSILPIAGLLIFTGLMFILVEKISQQKKDITKLSAIDSISIGLAQALALLPGISRSGATIVAGMYNGLKRESAARYSFLAAGPIVAIAGIYSLLELFQNPEITSWVGLALGFVTAFIAGLVAIHVLLNFLKNNKLSSFATYLIVVGLGLLGINFIFNV